MMAVCIIYITAVWISGLLSSYGSLGSKIPDHIEEERAYSRVNINDPVRGLAFEKNPNTATYQQAIDKKTENINEYIKDKRDLNAQEGMWRAATKLLELTTYHLIFLILSTIGSLVAVVFAYKAFRETNAANEIARENMVIGNKPLCNVYLSDVGVRRLHGVNQDKFTFHFKVVNFGKTPAINSFQKFFVIPDGIQRCFTEESDNYPVSMYERVMSSHGQAPMLENVARKHFIFPSPITDDEVKFPNDEAHEVEVAFYKRLCDEMNTETFVADGHDFCVIAITLWQSTIQPDTETFLYKTYQATRRKDTASHYFLAEIPSLTYLQETKNKDL